MSTAKKGCGTRLSNTLKVIVLCYTNYESGIAFTQKSGINGHERQLSSFNTPSTERQTFCAFSSYFGISADAASRTVYETTVRPLLLLNSTLVRRQHHKRTLQFLKTCLVSGNIVIRNISLYFVL